MQGGKINKKRRKKTSKRSKHTQNLQKTFTKGPVIIYAGGWGGEIIGGAMLIFFNDRGWVGIKFH